MTPIFRPAGMLPSIDPVIWTRLSPEVEAIAKGGPIDPSEMARALSALGRPLDDARTARDLSEARRRTASNDAALDAVRKIIRT